MARGCVFLPFSLGASSAPGLPGVAPPKLELHRMHPDDRPVLAKARFAGDRALEVLAAEVRRPDGLGPEAAGQVGARVVALLTSIYAVGEELGKARSFVVQHDPAALAKKRAELEVRELEEGALAKKAIAVERAALEERGRHAMKVQSDVGVLSARLHAAVATLEALQAKLARTAIGAGTPTARAQAAVQALDEEEREAKRALEAWTRTAKEMG